MTTTWDLDLLHLNGRSNATAESISPYAIAPEGFDMAPASRKYQWAESEFSSGGVPYGGEFMSNVERTLPVRIFARFTSALTNVLTNPRPGSSIGAWENFGTVSSVAIADLDGEDVVSVTTNGNANTGVDHPFTGTVAAHSGGVWVKTATSTAPIDVQFDSDTPTSITATTDWQLVKTENITLTAAARKFKVIQTDTGSRTIYVKWACVHLGSTYKGYFDGACGDARWTGTAHASTSTSLTGQDAISLAFGRLAEKSEKAQAKAGLGGLECFWIPDGGSYRSRIEVRAVDVTKLDYDYMHSQKNVANCEVKLTAHPYATGPEYTLATAYKAGGVPALEMLLTGAKGDIAGPLRIKLTNTSSNAFKYVVMGAHARDYVSGTDLILRAASLGVSGYSGTLTTKTDEVQTFSRTGVPASGTFTVTLDGQTTSAIAYNATAATIQAALEALGNIGTGNVTCTGGPIHTTDVVATFAGDMAGCNINLMTITDSVGGGDITCSATTAGVPGYVKADLFDAWTVICDTGNLSLLGSYRVLARVHDAAATTEIGDCQLKLVHGPGDLASPSENDPVSPAAVGDSCVVDLGQIHIDPVATGTQRYKGKILGRTDGTAGNDLRVLDLMFLPIETGCAEVKVIDSTDSTLSMFENFGATAGALTGDTATSGQTWATMGGLTDAVDFTETAAPDNAVIRTEVSDVNTDVRYGRGVILGSATPTDVSVSVNIDFGSSTTAGVYTGVIARFVDNDNFLVAAFSDLDLPGTVTVWRVTGGTVVTLASLPITVTSLFNNIKLTVRAGGDWSVAKNGIALAGGTDSVLATGGALASGKSGMLDWNPTATVITRAYSNFSVSIPDTADAAAHPSQDLEFREDFATRESSAGDYYSIPSGVRVTSPPLVVPTGSEGTSNRLLILASRFNPNLASDPYADSFTVQALATPVYALAASED